jgi:hypothetical protein
MEDYHSPVRIRLDESEQPWYKGAKDRDNAGTRVSNLATG